MREEHPWKAFFPIVVTPSGTTTSLAHVGFQLTAVVTASVADGSLRRVIVVPEAKALDATVTPCAVAHMNIITTRMQRIATAIPSGLKSVLDFGAETGAEVSCVGELIKRRGVD